MRQDDQAYLEPLVSSIAFSEVFNFFVIIKTQPHDPALSARMDDCSIAVLPFSRFSRTAALSSIVKCSAPWPRSLRWARERVNPSMMRFRALGVAISLANRSASKYADLGGTCLESGFGLLTAAHPFGLR